jgi:anti-sigma factor RsiW
MAGTIPCPPVEDLQRFLVGQLSEAEAEGLERHLAGCRRCVARLDTLRPCDRLLDAVFAVAHGDAAPADEVDAGLLGSLYRLGRQGDAARKGLSNPLGLAVSPRIARPACRA